MNDVLAFPWFDEVCDVRSLRGGEEFVVNEESINEFLKRYNNADGGIHFELSILVKDNRTGNVYNTSIHRLAGCVKSFNLSTLGLTLTMRDRDNQLYNLIDRGITPCFDENLENERYIELYENRAYNYAVSFANFSQNAHGVIVPHGICVVPEGLDELPDDVYYCSPRGHI